MASTASKLRPAKIRSALRRRWFERQVPRVAMRDVRGGIIELGTPYGGWMMPAELLGRSWVCYCVGSGADISFDLALLERYDATVRAFDAVAEYVEIVAEQASGHAGFSAHHAAVATSDGPMRMQVTHDAQSKSVSASGLYDTSTFVELPGRTLPSLMKELGDERIDLLKLDVEGAEYEILPTLDLQAMNVKIFASQLHHNGSVRQARALIANLREQGYEPVACRYAVKLTFVRQDLLA